MHSLRQKNTVCAVTKSYALIRTNNVNSLENALYSSECLCFCVTRYRRQNYTTNISESTFLAPVTTDDHTRNHNNGKLNGEVNIHWQNTNLRTYTRLKTRNTTRPPKIHHHWSHIITTSSVKFTHCTAMFATADYDVANEGHDKPYTYGRSKYPRCKLYEDGEGTAEGGRETAQMLGHIRPRRTCAGCLTLSLSLSHSSSFCLRNPRSAIFKCYSCSFLSGYFPYTLFIFYYFSTVIPVLFATNPATHNYSRSKYAKSLTH